jgi:DNA replication protein DnaC
MNPFKIEELESEKRICPIHGEYEAKKIRLSALSQTFVTLGCPKCEEEQDKRMNEISQLDIYRSYNIPERFIETSIDTFEHHEKPSLIRAVELCKRYGESTTNGRNLLILGVPGSGKTLLATSVLKLTPGDNKSYVTIIDFANEIKSTYSKSRSYLEERRESIIKRYTYIEYLVLDNIEELQMTADNKKLMFELINGRYDNNRNTIVCSKLTQKELSDYIGFSLFRKIRERGAVIELEEAYI